VRPYWVDFRSEPGRRERREEDLGDALVARIHQSTFPGCGGAEQAILTLSLMCYARLYPFGDRATPGGDFRHHIWGEFLKVRRKWRHAKTFPHRESMTYTRRIFCHREMDKVELRDRLPILGIDQQHLTGALQDVEDGFPVVAGARDGYADCPWGGSSARKASSVAEQPHFGNQPLWRTTGPGCYHRRRVAVYLRQRICYHRCGNDFCLGFLC
jgi:hypothetical protein